MSTLSIQPQHHVLWLFLAHKILLSSRIHWRYLLVVLVKATEVPLGAELMGSTKSNSQVNPSELLINPEERHLRKIGMSSISRSIYHDRHHLEGVEEAPSSRGRQRSG
jgi:hypothetical protein